MPKPPYDSLWHVYIAQCRGGSLYTGIALDVAKRIHEHNTTSRCRYTRYRKPLVLMYSECCENYAAARVREYAVKDMSRKRKLELISGRKISRRQAIVDGSRSKISQDL